MILRRLARRLDRRGAVARHAGALGAALVALAGVPAGAAAQATVVAAGDIACSPASSAFNGGLGTDGPDGRCHQKHTSDLFIPLDPTVVLPLGDTQYGDATYADYLSSYDRRDADGTPMSWGRAKAISRPVIGNHEYAERDPATGAFTGARAYFDYFNGPGAATGPAGDRDKAYYSFDVAAGTRPDGSSVLWHLVALNSNCAAQSEVTAGNGWSGGCDVGSAQERWLRADLAAAAQRADCTLAYWHHPRFSATGGGDNGVMAPMWQALLEHSADVVLAGHHHNYQRFAALDAAGVEAPGRGLRQFVVGTGGHSLGTPPGLSRPVQAFDNTTYGVLRLTLHDGWYEWEFVPDGRSGTFRDSGRDDCVQPAPAIRSGPDGPTSARRARFTFSGRSAAGFQCRLDAGSWQPCGSSADYAGLTDGEHVFAVRAASPTGTSELAAAERRFRVDTTPPRVTTGISSRRVLTGSVALDAAPVDASPITQVRWLLDGRVVATDAAAPWTAAWDSRAARDGRHRLQLHARDAAGNVGRSRRMAVTIANPLRARLMVAARARVRAVRTRGLPVALRCTNPCRVVARLVLDARTARRLVLPPQIAGARTARLRERHERIRLTVRPALLRRLARVRRVPARVVVVATDADRRTRTVRRNVVLRR